MAVWGAPIGIALAMWIVFWIVSFFIVWFLLSIYCYKNESYKYKNKHVIITGGSSGIGLEMAKIYLSLGANVTIVARDKKKLEVAVKELSILIHTDSKSNTNTDRIESISLNVSSDLDTVTKALASSISKFGPCDVLVNCAGTSIAHPFSSTENDSFRRMYEVNLLGSVYTTQAVLDGMRKQRSGRIIFVSSQLGQLGLHGYTAYCASKFALRGFAEALQMELKVYNVYVSVAHPPDTQTPGYDVEMISKVRPYNIFN